MVRQGEKPHDWASVRQASVTQVPERSPLPEERIADAGVWKGAQNVVDGRVDRGSPAMRGPRGNEPDT
jgi:hypothetical protein